MYYRCISTHAHDDFVAGRRLGSAADELDPAQTGAAGARRLLAHQRHAAAQELHEAREQAARGHGQVTHPGHQEGKLRVVIMFTTRIFNLAF